MKTVTMPVLKTLQAIAIALVLSAGASNHAIPANSPIKSEHRKLIDSARKPAPRAEFHVRHDPWLNAPTASARGVDAATAAPRAEATSPPNSPGLLIGNTWRDLQHTHSQGHRVTRNPNEDRPRMVWDCIQDFDTSGQWLGTEVFYNTYVISTGTLMPGLGGTTLSYTPIFRAGSGNLDVGDDNWTHVVMHEREDVSLPRRPWYSQLQHPHTPFQIDYDFGGSGACGEGLWPKGVLQQRPSAPDILHAVFRSGTSCDREYLLYARYFEFWWSEPVIIDSTFSPGFVIATDNNSDAVAIVFHDIDDASFNGANNIVYYESTNSGADWLSGAGLGSANRHVVTMYNDTLAGPQAWRNIDVLYDNQGTLHVIWDEQEIANQTANVTIQHWNDLRNTIRPVTLGFWPQPFHQTSLNLAGLSMGIGDGATTCATGPGGNNLDYLYVTYTQYCGPGAIEQGDTSISGYCNGEIYYTMSATGGDTWSAPVNLTQTKTPDCDPSAPETSCRSEDWASMNKVVRDIDLIYISDRDAGAAPLGEGTYRENDVMYLRIPGGIAADALMCPSSNPVFAATITSSIECEYHAAPGEVKSDATLTLMNLGNGPLTGNISILTGAPWLSVAGSGNYTIPSGDPNLTLPITMDATGLSEGMYPGIIRITHNDSNVPSPQDYGFNFFVITDFRCSQRSVISTGVE